MYAMNHATSLLSNFQVKKSEAQTNQQLVHIQIAHEWLSRGSGPSPGVSQSTSSPRAAEALPSQWVGWWRPGVPYSHAFQQITGAHWTETQRFGKGSHAASKSVWEWVVAVTLRPVWGGSEGQQ